MYHLQVSIKDTVTELRHKPHFTKDLTTLEEVCEAIDRVTPRQSRWSVLISITGQAEKPQL